jgi:Tfp pilus assembly PilM family ATPase
MKRRTAVLILESDRVELLALQGRTLADRQTLATQLDVREDGFRAAVRKLKPTLADAVNQAQLSGAPCVVYYRSASAVVHLVSTPTSSAQDALHAAHLALNDALSYPVEAAATDAAFLCRSAGGKSAHALAAGDRTSTVNALVELIEGAHLKLQAAVPIDATLHADLVRRAAAFKSDAPAALLHLGLHASALAVVEEGEVKLFRPLAFTLEQLLDALQKPLHTGAESQAGVDRDTALDWLGAFGVPDREETIDQAAGVTGAAVRPVLQPILQRLVTEIRQSIRFGVSEEQRLSVRLHADGAGATIRNLAGTLHHELNLPVDVAKRDDAATDDFFAPTRRCCLEDADDPTLELLPDELAARVQLGRFKRHLWTGVAAAGLLLALDAGLLHQKINSAEQALRPMEATVSEQARADDVQSSLAAATHASHALENEVARHWSSQPAVSAMLRALAEITPPRVRLLNVEFRARDDAPRAMIEGYADTGGRGGGEIIRGYIAELAALPGVQQAELTNVQETTADGGDWRQFRLSLRLTPPARPLDSGRMQQLVASGEEQRP